MRWLHHVAHDFDASRHFLAGQVHPGNWFGNIVAGVVVFIFVDVCWRLFAKELVTKFVRKIHAEEIARHHREVVKPEADARHAEAMAQAERHNASQRRQARYHHEVLKKALQPKETT
jgi:hypothetical protein